MRKISIILSAVVMTVIMISSCGGASIREGASYEEVTIGDQVWMMQNLNVDKFRNGDPIPEARTDDEWTKSGDNGEPAWCYVDNDPANLEKYGRLYNWHAVKDPRGLAPDGWHIPTDAEWRKLTDYLGYEAGDQMKSTSGWNIEGNGSNDSRFWAVPSGGRANDRFFGVGSSGYFWSSTEYNSGNAVSWALSHESKRLSRYDYFAKRVGFSVRCLKD